MMSSLQPSSPAAPPPAPSVHGVVADPTGAIVPGAEVDLVDTNGSIAGTCHSGDDGSFQLAAPHAGNFTLVVSEPGFETVTTPVVIAAAGYLCRSGHRRRHLRRTLHIVLPIAARRHQRARQRRQPAKT